MGCCGNSSNNKSNLTYQHNFRTNTVSQWQRSIIEKWTLGAVHRRRFKKLVQLKQLGNLNKPHISHAKQYDEDEGNKAGKLHENHSLHFHHKNFVASEQREPLYNESDLAYIMSSEGGGQGLYWDTLKKPISKNRRYQGQWKASKRHSQWQGLGTIYYPDGSKYQGMTLHGVFEGRGRMTHSNGDIYHGEWKDGKANGTGVFLDKKGNIYDGQWVNDQYHGKGHELWDFGKVEYKGNFIEGKKTGKGVFTFDRNNYRGDFVEGQFHGNGVYHFADTRKTYTGQFANNNMHGQGRMEWPDGHGYVGDFEDGAFNGQGKMIYDNGDIYEGEWENDERHGEGKYFCAKNGKTRVGEWVNDEEQNPNNSSNAGTPWKHMRVKKAVIRNDFLGYQPQDQRRTIGRRVNDDISSQGVAYGYQGSIFGNEAADLYGPNYRQPLSQQKVVRKVRR